MKNERIPQIMYLLSAQGFVNVKELANRLDVSMETIRRDLSGLEEAGIITKIHGGAVASPKRAIELAYKNRKNLLMEEKYEIARLTSELIDDGDTVIITSGTTTLALAEFLLKKTGLTVITNSILLSAELAGSSSMTIYSLGGKVRNGNFSLSGAIAMQSINIFSADKLILSVGGITSEQGLTDYEMDESMLVRACMDSADSVIAIADHSKFGIVAKYKVCPVKRVHHLVTSTLTPASILDQFGKMGVQIHAAPMEKDGE